MGRDPRANQDGEVNDECLRTEWDAWLVGQQGHAREHADADPPEQGESQIGRRTGHTLTPPNNPSGPIDTRFLP